MDNREHKMPHIHIEYQDYAAVVSIPEIEMLAGDFPKNKMKLLKAWAEIHKEELEADWKLAVEGSPVFKIDALK
jgi:hypothetical protein